MKKPAARERDVRFVALGGNGCRGQWCEGGEQLAAAGVDVEHPGGPLQRGTGEPVV